VLQLEIKETAKCDMLLGMWLIRVKIPVITLEDKDVCPFNNFSGTLVTGFKEL
jgi:hypothetical protein